MGKKLKKLIEMMPASSFQFKRKINKHIEIGLTQPDEHWDKWGIKPEQTKWNQLMAKIKFSFGKNPFKK